MPIAADDFWEDLLDLIEAGNVLPVVGQGVTTMAPDDELLAPWLASNLAERLKIGSTMLPPQPTLHDVICRHLINGGDSADLGCRHGKKLAEPLPLNNYPAQSPSGNKRRCQPPRLFAVTSVHCAPYAPNVAIIAPA